MSEECVIVSLISGCINNFKSDVLDCVHDFYKTYDPTKSLDKSYILDLIENVNKSLRNIVEEIL